MNGFFIYVIGLYRRYISPFLPPACRFTPTCSEYAVEAFSRKSTLTALWMTVARLAKCHPFHPGGYDPVECRETTDASPQDAVRGGASCSCGHRRTA